MSGKNQTQQRNAGAKNAQRPPRTQQAPATAPKPTPAPPAPVEAVQVNDTVVETPTPLKTEEAPETPIETAAPKVEETPKAEEQTPPAPAPAPDVPKTPAEERRNRMNDRSNFLAEAVKVVEARPENPALAKATGEPISKEERPEDRPAIFKTIDEVMDPFLEKMMPGVAISEKEAGDLHYGVSMLIRSLLITGGPDMKIGIPYLFAIYRQYANSIFHPQNHHRGVGMMRGSEADINFYRNISRIFVDLANPDAVELVLARTDIAHFKKLTMNVSSPAAETIAKNLATVLSRASVRASK